MSPNGEPVVAAREHGVAQVLEVRAAEVREADQIARLGAELRRAIDASDRPYFVLDLSAVEYLSSVALGLVINLHAHLSDRGYAFGLIVPEGDVRAIFELAKLERIVPIYADLDSAVRGFCSGV